MASSRKTSPSPPRKFSRSPQYNQGFKITDIINRGQKIKRDQPRTEPRVHSISMASVSESCLRRTNKQPRRLKKSPCRSPCPHSPCDTNRQTSRPSRSYVSQHLEHLSRPKLQNVLNTWREHKKELSPEQISRFRDLLDADKPQKPAQAYDYFASARMKKSKNRNRTKGANKKGLKDASNFDSYFNSRKLCTPDLVVKLIKAMQSKFATPMVITLDHGMQRLSSIVLQKICKLMKVKEPKRGTRNPKAKLMVEVADQTASWIEDILSACDDNMLVMDEDEDDDVVGKTLDFLNLDPDFAGQWDESGDDRPRPAYESLTGDHLDSFKILTREMDHHHDKNLIQRDILDMTYKEGSHELRKTADFTAHDYDHEEKQKTHEKLNAVVANKTPEPLKQTMGEITEMASKYLAHAAKHQENQHKANDIIIKEMMKRGDDTLVVVDDKSETHYKGALRLKKGLATGLIQPEPEAIIAQKINDELTNATKSETPPDLQKPMEVAIKNASEYLSTQVTKPDDDIDSQVKLIKSMEGAGSKLLFTGNVEKSYENSAEYLKSLTTHKDRINKPDAEMQKSTESKLKTLVEGQNVKEAVIKDNAKLLVSMANKEAEDAAKKAEASGGAGGADGSGGAGGGGAEGAGGAGGADASGRAGGADASGRAGGARGAGGADASGRAGGAGGSSGGLGSPGQGGLSEDEKRKRASQAELMRQKQEAEQIMHRELNRKGSEVFHSTSTSKLTHQEGSDWLKTDKTDSRTRPSSGEVQQLSAKMHSNLSTIVSNKTPEELKAAMQDVVEDSSKRLASKFANEENQQQANEIIIRQMLKQGDETLVTVDDTPESHFKAALRLKKGLETGLKEKNPDVAISQKINEELANVTQPHTPSKLKAAMKDALNNASDYLSTRVTKPDDDIDSEIKLIKSMEGAGEKLLFDDKIEKSYGTSADYLKSLVSNKDKIDKSNPSLQKATEGKLRTLVAGQNVKDAVIRDKTKQLVSLVSEEEAISKDLKVIVESMDKKGDENLLWHGDIGKSFKDGADLLRDKTADKLMVDKSNPISYRKVDVKLTKMMDRNPNYKNAIKVASKYLSIKLLEPVPIRVCKCMKNRSLQCELWTNEILRNINRPCCECKTSAPAPDNRSICTNNSSYRIKFLPCSRSKVKQDNSYSSPVDGPCRSLITSSHGSSITTYFVMTKTGLSNNKIRSKRSDSSTGRVIPTMMKEYSQFSKYDVSDRKLSEEDISELHISLGKHELIGNGLSLANKLTQDVYKPLVDKSSISPCELLSESYLFKNTKILYDRKQSISYSSSTVENKTRAPIIATGKIVNWYTMTVGFFWNIQAWRGWVQENIDVGMNYKFTSGEEDSWYKYRQKVLAEIMSWRIYNTFSHQITARLKSKNQQILINMKSHDDHETLKGWIQEIILMKNIFNRWTQWFAIVILEIDAIRNKDHPTVPLNKLRWLQFKKIVVKCSGHWIKYDNYLQDSYFKKYSGVISSFLPLWSQNGPVWVISASGAVPSGAISAGVYEKDRIWLARVSHKTGYLPASVNPSKFCAWVYTDGKVFYHSKYQVLCNAKVSWISWQSGIIQPHAVTVSPGVYIGRVTYQGSHLIGAVRMPHNRCDVVIHGQPFSFNTYELLVLSSRH